MTALPAAIAARAVKVAAAVTGAVAATTVVRAVKVAAAAAAVVREMKPVVNPGASPGVSLAAIGARGASVTVATTRDLRPSSRRHS